MMQTTQKHSNPPNDARSPHRDFIEKILIVILFALNINHSSETTQNLFLFI